MAPVNQSSLSGLPSTLPNPVTMHEGLIVRGNVFVNWHLDPKYPMNIGLDPCYGTGLPCDKPTVSGGRAARDRMHGCQAGQAEATHCTVGVAHGMCLGVV